MRQIAGISTLAHPQLRSPSPSEMDPTDARDEDGRPPSSPLENLRRPESPEPTNSASEYPSPPQRGTKLNDGHDTIDGVLDDSAERSRATPFKLNTTFHPTDKESRQRSSSPLAPSPYSTSHRAAPETPYNTIVMQTKPKTETPHGSATRAMEKRRPARMPYTREQDDFIRFVRDDLSHSWETSALLYNQYWHPTGEGKREIPGLQSRYYRLLEQPMRDRKRKIEPGPLSRRKAEAKDSLGRPEEGILAKTNRRYYWMEGYYTYEEREQMRREQEEQEGMERVSKRQRREEPDSQDAASDHTEKDDDDYEDDEELPDAAPAEHASADDDSLRGSHDALPDRE